jgi:hypothetical protein
MIGPNETFPLPGGHNVKVYDEIIKIGDHFAVDFNRPVRREDVQALCVLYSMGMATVQNQLAQVLMAFNSICNPVEIVAFSFGGEEDP